jgi:hypothetical protein
VKRTPLKKKQLRRDWSLALLKKEEAIESGEGCRVCGTLFNLQIAHTVGRQYDPTVIGPRGGKLRMVPPQAVVILCGGDHFKYDAFALSILALVTEKEYEYAVQALGEERARRRLSGGIV